MIRISLTILATSAGFAVLSAKAEDDGTRWSIEIGVDAKTPTPKANGVSPLIAFGYEAIPSQASDRSR